jgi:hypothetical protein
MSDFDKINKQDEQPQNINSGEQVVLAQAPPAKQSTPQLQKAEQQENRKKVDPYQQPAHHNIVPVDRFEEGETVAGAGKAVEDFFKEEKQLDDKTKDKAAVRALQQALIDLRVLDPKKTTLGTYDSATEKAVVTYRDHRGNHLKKDKEFDKSDKTLVEDHFDSREAYLEAAVPNKKKKATRPLDATDKDNLKGIYNPNPKSTTASTTTTAAPSAVDKDMLQTYKDALKSTAKGFLISAKKKKYEAKEDQREKGEAIEKENDEIKKSNAKIKDKSKHQALKDNPYLLSKDAVSSISEAAKDAVDGLYGGQISKKVNFSIGVNLLDQWEEGEAAVKDYKTITPENATSAKGKSAGYYTKEARTFLIKNLRNFHEVQGLGKLFNIPKAEQEKALSEIVDELLKEPSNIEDAMRAEQGWSGMASGGKQYLQRFKSTDSAPSKKAEADRKKRWKTFYTSIHEYLHLVMHDKYDAWVEKQGTNKNNILTEGVCEFFTLNVYAALNGGKLEGYKNQIDGLKKGVPNKNAVLPFKGLRELYPQHKQAEQIAKTVGIHNLQEAYFKGKTALIDDK